MRKNIPLILCLILFSSLDSNAQAPKKGKSAKSKLEFVQLLCGLSDHINYPKTGAELRQSILVTENAFAVNSVDGSLAYATSKLIILKASVTSASFTSFEYPGGADRLFFSRDGLSLILTTTKGEVLSYDVSSKKLLWSTKITGRVKEWHLHPIHSWLALGSDNGSLIVIDSRAGTEILSLKKAGRVRPLFLPDGNHLCVAYEDKIEFYAIESGGILEEAKSSQKYEKSGCSFATVAVHPDSDKIIVISDKGIFEINPKDGKLKTVSEVGRGPEFFKFSAPVGIFAAKEGLWVCHLLLDVKNDYKVIRETRLQMDREGLVHSPDGSKAYYWQANVGLAVYNIDLDAPAGGIAVGEIAHGRIAYRSRVKDLTRWHGDNTLEFVTRGISSATNFLWSLDLKKPNTATQIWEGGRIIHFDKKQILAVGIGQKKAASKVLESDPKLYHFKKRNGEGRALDEWARIVPSNNGRYLAVKKSGSRPEVYDVKTKQSREQSEEFAMLAGVFVNGDSLIHNTSGGSKLLRVSKRGKILWTSLVESHADGYSIGPKDSAIVTENSVLLAKNGKKYFDIKGKEAFFNSSGTAVITHEKKAGDPTIARIYGLKSRKLKHKIALAPSEKIVSISPKFRYVIVSSDDTLGGNTILYRLKR